MMESENAADESSAVASLLPLASGAQQPYVSELLSFTLDRLHKVPYLPLSLLVCLTELLFIFISFRVLGTGASSGRCGANTEANARGGGE